MVASPIHFVKEQSENALCGLIPSARSQTTGDFNKMTCKACVKAYMQSKGYSHYEPSTHREDRE